MKTQSFSLSVTLQIPYWLVIYQVHLVENKKVLFKSSVESTPFNIDLKTQNNKMHFYSYYCDVACNFKKRIRGNTVHTLHINKKENAIHM